MAINQIITDIPTPPSSKDSANFRTRADAFMASLDNLADELNTFGNEANSLEANVNAKEQSAQDAATISQVAANFKGAWDSATAYTHPSAVIYNGVYYISLQDSTNQDPTTTTAYWAVVKNQANTIHTTGSGLPNELETAVAPNIKGFKNLIINGGFDVWQRGTASTGATNGSYVADRWVVYSTISDISFDYIRSAGDFQNTQFPYGIKLTQTAGSGTMILHQFIENVTQFKVGSTYTLSFYAFSTTAHTISVDLIARKGGWANIISGAAQTISLSTTPKRYEVQLTIPDWTALNIDYGNLQDTDLAVRLDNGIMQPDLIITGVQLEEGSVATPFEQRPYGLELSLCQRYYEASDTRVEGSLNFAKATLIFALQFKQSKRVIPSMTVGRTFPSLWTPNGESIGKDAYWCFVNDVTSYWTITGYTADAEIY